MSIFIISRRFFIFIVFYIEYSFAVNDQVLIQQIYDLKLFAMNYKTPDTETYFYEMSDTGVCFESATNGISITAVAYSVCQMDIFRMPDSLGGAEYCAFNFSNTTEPEAPTLHFWDIDIKMFVFYHELKIKLFLRHETITDIIVLEFDIIPLVRKFWSWTQNDATPGKDEKNLITVPKFETYLLDKGRLNSETTVKVDKSIVSDDLIFYTFWVESDDASTSNIHKKLLLIFSSNRYTHSSILSFKNHPIIIVKVRETSKEYFFVLHFNGTNDANQFFIDIDYNRGDIPLLPDQIVDNLWLVDE